MFPMKKREHKKNHNYLVKMGNQSAISIPSSLSAKVLPFISSENFLIKSNSKDSSLESSGRCIRTTTIAGNFNGENSAVFKKSLSRVNKTLCFSHANEYSLEFLMPFGANIMSMPLFESDLTSLASTSSSAKNLSFDVNESFTSQSFSSVMQSGLNMFFSQGWIGFDDFFISGTTFQHLQNLPHHNSGAFESGLTMTDFTIRDNILINFGSHRTDYDNEVFKDIENQRFSGSAGNLGFTSDYKKQTR